MKRYYFTLFVLTFLSLPVLSTAQNKNIPKNGSNLQLMDMISFFDSMPKPEREIALNKWGFKRALRENNIVEYIYGNDIANIVIFPKSVRFRVSRNRYSELLLEAKRLDFIYQPSMDEKVKNGSNLEEKSYYYKGGIYLSFSISDDTYEKASTYYIVSVMY